MAAMLAWRIGLRAVVPGAPSTLPADKFFSLNCRVIRHVRVVTHMRDLSGVSPYTRFRLLSKGSSPSALRMLPSIRDTYFRVLMSRRAYSDCNIGPRTNRGKPCWERRNIAHCVR
jgi:hypothetical protein